MTKHKHRGKLRRFLKRRDGQATFSVRGELVTLKLVELVGRRAWRRATDAWNMARFYAKQREESGL